jgi:hypothetical protein
MPRGNLGIAGKIKLAQMAALTPLAQMFADQGGPDFIGTGGGGSCVHGFRKLARKFHAFHYLGRNGLASAGGSSSRSAGGDASDPGALIPSILA